MSKIERRRDIQVVNPQGLDAQSREQLQKYAATIGTPMANQ
jgi:hypothetical protein